MQQTNNGKIGQVLQAINILPLLILGSLMIFVSYRWFSNVMHQEVHVELQYVTENTNTLLNTAYPGDYTLVGDSALRLFKGETDITECYELIDEIKQNTDLEITLFYQDTRILTTIRDSAGTRIVGTGAPAVVIEDVLTRKQPAFYENTLINGFSYFSYYMPVCNSDGSVVGMLFVGKPAEQVNLAVKKSLYPLILIMIVILLTTSLVLFAYTRRLSLDLTRVRNFLAEVAGGNLNAVLDSHVIKRRDEFGDIGRSTITMQRSLRTMVEQDTLTQLFNRRSADRKLRPILSRYETEGVPFCVSIGDIDFFKKVNDTYGHDCGDLVLKAVASTLQEFMRTYGFVARWGGEEFLLVFDHSDYEQAKAALEQLLERIRSIECNYEEQTIHITMTFGLARGDSTDVLRLLKTADDKLYEGKAGGRNRVV